MILPAHASVPGLHPPALQTRPLCSGEQRPADGAMRGVADSLHHIFVVLLFHVGRWNFAGETTQ